VARYKYIGSHSPVKSTGKFIVRIPTGRGTLEISFAPGESFEVNDPVAQSHLEYRKDPWTREYDFIRVPDAS
jgi:hypothetical protein